MFQFTHGILSNKEWHFLYSYATIDNMLQFILGRAGSGKTDLLYQTISHRVANRLPGALLLVPEQYSHAAERELLTQAGNSACLFADVFSFTRLAARVQDETGGGSEPPLDNGGRILTMRMAMESAAADLRLYAARAKDGNRPEFLTGLLDTIDELKQAEITVDELASAAAQTSGILHDKLHDLSRILSAYNAWTKRRDPRDTLSKLADTLADSSYVNCAVFLDGFSDFTAQEMRILQAFLAAKSNVTIALTCDGLADTESNESDIFRPAVVTANRLKSYAESHGHTIETTVLPIRDTRPVQLQAVEQFLFADNLPNPIPPAAPSDANNAVQLFEAANPAQECELAAAMARTLVTEQGYRYRDIAVCARGTSDYETMAQHAFTRYHVPLGLVRKTKVLDTPILTLFTAALDMLDGAFRYDAAFRYLRTGLAGITPQETDLLEQYAKMWNISGTQWTRTHDWTGHPKGFRADFKEADKKQLIKLNALRHRVGAPFVQLANAGRAARTAAAQVTALYDFLEAISLPQTLADEAERLRSAGQDTKAAEYSQIWDILVSALEQTHSILGDTPMDRAECSALIRLVLSQYSLGSIPQTLDRVQFGDLDRTRRRDVKCLIVLGASDDRLPAPPTERGILTETERLQLRDLEIELSESAQERFYREEALIYHAFTAPTERLVLTYPGGGTVGSDHRQQKSPIVARLEAIFDRPVMPISALEPAFFLTAEAPLFDLALCADHETQYALSAAARSYFLQDQTPRFRGALQRTKSRRGRLSQEMPTRLYGDCFNLSASRIEGFNSCHFRYFLQYGLRAAAPRRAEMDGLLVGDFLHTILEHSAKDILAAGDFSVLNADVLAAIVKRRTEMYKARHMGDFAKDNPRLHYQFRRLAHEAQEVVSDFAAEMRRSDFTPLAFELVFGGAGGNGNRGRTLPPAQICGNGFSLRLSGKVDRVDTWVYDGVRYLRVVDYKSKQGDVGVSFAELWHGEGLQALLYLAALMQSGKALTQDNLPLAPAGLLYAPAKDVIVDAAPDAERADIDAARQNARKRRGLILNDLSVIHAMERGEPKRYLPIKLKKDGTPDKKSSDAALITYDEWSRLTHHVETTVLAIAKKMHRGIIDANPPGGCCSNPCTYCDYRSICHYEPEADGIRYLEKIDREEMFEILQEGAAEI